MKSFWTNLVAEDLEGFMGSIDKSFTIYFNGEPDAMKWDDRNQVQKLFDTFDFIAVAPPSNL